MGDVGELELGEHVGTDPVGAEPDRIGESDGVRVPDGVVHVRARVVDDRAAQPVVVGQVHAVDQQPVVAGEVAEPVGRPDVVRALRDVDVDADPVRLGEFGGVDEMGVGAGERGVDADHPAAHPVVVTFGELAEVPVVLREAAQRAARRRGGR